MYLSKLEIQGFKSFAEKVSLEFNRELTAVVGPNGSGKSNISDAVRWVLGEQSLKLLRGKKSQDVIFAGSDKKTRLGFAEVNLYLDNADGRAPIDFREVVITRRIYRDGEGEYLINKNKVRLTDIQLLLAKASFGQRSYSIVGQGMIDSMLTSSPAERKELFDEATGVRQFQIKKDQAILKLSKSQENLGQSTQLLVEIEPRLKSLSRQVKKLEKKAEIEKELSDLQNSYYSCLLIELEDKINLQTARHKEAVNNKDKKQSELELLEKEIAREQTADTEALAFQKLQLESQALNQDKNRLLQELSAIKGKMDLDLTKAGKINIVWLQNRLNEINLILRQRAKDKTELTEKIDQQSANLNQKALEQKKVLAEFNSLQTKINETRAVQSSDSSLSASALKNHLSDLYQKQKNFVEYLSETNSIDLIKVKNLADELLEKIEWLSGQLSEENTSDDQELARLQSELQTFLNTKDLLVNEIQEQRITLEVSRQKMSGLENELSGLEQEKIKLAKELAANSGSADTSEILTSQKIELEKQINELDHKINELEKQLNSFAEQQKVKKAKLWQIQSDIRAIQTELESFNNIINDCQIELAKLNTKKEDLLNELSREFIGDFQPLEKMPNLNLIATEAEIGRLKNQLAIIGAIDEETITEYKEVEERYNFLSEQTIDLKSAIDSCHQLIDELDLKITKQFEEAFKKINEKFQHYFRILFDGGNARLILQKNIITDQADEEAEADNSKAEQQTSPTAEKISPVSGRKKIEYGIEIQATPPGKKLQSINSLSGGEKALTSIALISSIIANNPSPFVILDEVDAALDEANSIRFAKIVAELSGETQFICITHNRATMEQAAILYGVTMKDDGISKLLSINLKEAEKVAE